MVVDVQCYVGRSLDIVQQAESLGSYGADIVGDYPSYTAASAMVEAADRLTDHEAGLQHYLLLVGALRSLSRREHPPGLTLDSYLLRALSIAGWAPSFVDCAVTGAPGPHTRVRRRSSAAWSPTPSRLPARPGSIPRRSPCSPRCSRATGRPRRPPTSAPSAQASGVVAAYTQFHLERGLRSLRARRPDERQ